MIWIVGGTKDSRDILNKLIESGFSNIVVSTATNYGGKLLEDVISKNEDKNIRSVSEKMENDIMENFIKENSIDLVIDASHPYAQNVSRNVIGVSNKLGVKYIRFERKMLDYDIENVIKFEKLSDMVKFITNQSGKNILSTLGSNNLEEIKSMGEKNNLYVRILPTTDSIQKAENMGYLPSKIIAIQGPIDKILNKAMLESYKIDYLITKESGATGGEQEKVEACKEVGATILVLKRPFVDYGIIYDSIDELVSSIEK